MYKTICGVACWISRVLCRVARRKDPAKHWVLSHSHKSKATSFEARTSGSFSGRDRSPSELRVQVLNATYTDVPWLVHALRKMRVNKLKAVLTAPPDHALLPKPDVA